MKTKRIFDLTPPISPDLPVWPGNPVPKLTFMERLEKGSSSNLSRIEMGSHTSSHIDAPLHFVKGGKGIEKLDPNVLVGKAIVCDCTDVSEITETKLRSLRLRGVERVLFKTRNSQIWKRCGRNFQKKFVYLTEDGARYLVGARHALPLLVGIDYLSIERFGARPHRVHEILLGAGILIVEGLDLTGVKPGRYELFCGPLKMVGAEGAPCRVFLREM